MISSHAITNHTIKHLLIYNTTERTENELNIPKYCWLPLLYVSVMGYLRSCDKTVDVERDVIVNIAFSHTVLKIFFSSKVLSPVVYLLPFRKMSDCSSLTLAVALYALKLSLPNILKDKASYVLYFFLDI